MPSWYVNHADKFDGGSNAFNTLIESTAKTGILVIERLNDKKLALGCINCLYSIANDSLKKTTSKYGYDEPRIMEKMCHLGILALKKGWDDIVVEIGLKIYEFEEKYYKKYFTDIPDNINPADHNVIGLPHSDEIRRQLSMWQSDISTAKLNNYYRLRDDSEALVSNYVERIDIDRFIFEIWGEFIVGSEFEEELKLKLERKNLILTFKKIINKNTSQNQ